MADPIDRSLPPGCASIAPTPIKEALLRCNAVRKVADDERLRDLAERRASEVARFADLWARAGMPGDFIPSAAGGAAEVIVPEWGTRIVYCVAEGANDVLLALREGHAWADVERQARVCEALHEFHVCSYPLTREAPLDVEGDMMMAAGMAIPASTKEAVVGIASAETSATLVPTDVLALENLPPLPYWARTARAEAKLAEAIVIAKAGIEREQELQTKLRVVHAGVDDVWFWQGDGQDHPESLSCPVVMSADTLRAMLARAQNAEDRAAAERALRQAERDVAIRMTDRGICGYLALDDACQDARRKLSALSALGGAPIEAAASDVPTVHLTWPAGVYVPTEESEARRRAAKPDSTWVSLVTRAGADLLCCVDELAGKDEAGNPIYVAECSGTDRSRASRRSGPCGTVLEAQAEAEGFAIKIIRERQAELQKTLDLLTGAT